MRISDWSSDVCSSDLTLLRILFSVVADPTLKNRQGPDTGSQYRAAIVPMDANQRQVANAYLAQIGRGKYFAKPIVVPVETYKRFYRAEASHQDFMRRNPRHGYHLRRDAPKPAALERLSHRTSVVTGKRRYGRGDPGALPIIQKK